MRHANTLYTGNRVYGPRGQFMGVTVKVNDAPLSLPESYRLSGGFEWGYGGAGAAQLALALVLDATGDPMLAIRTYTFFKWAKVACWGAEWSITAGEVREWVRLCVREDVTGSDVVTSRDGVPMGCAAVRRCRECGCTDADCRQCIAATGVPCSWVGAEEDLCSRCAEEADTAVLDAEREGGAS